MKQHKIGSNRKYPFDKMAVHDSLLITEADRNRVATAAQYAKKQGLGTFSFRKDKTTGELRVVRTA